MKLEKQCKTCEFNFDGVCTGHGTTYKYGENITDETRICEDWSAGLEYFTYTTTNAPRFLREQYNDCRISYSGFSSWLDDYQIGKGIPINFFDAIKFIYGISMVDIAVLLDVSFGVVYRAKTKGIPPKRVKKFSDVLCVSPDLLTSVTTENFDKLRECKKIFFSQPNIELRMNSMPEWKKDLANIISASYLQCPIHIAKEITRVDKLYWAEDMPMDDFTESEKILISYITRKSKKHEPAFSLDYFLDLACKPHMRIEMPNSEDEMYNDENKSTLQRNNRLPVN